MNPSSSRGGLSRAIRRASLPALALALAIPAGVFGAPEDQKSAPETTSVEKKVKRQRSGAGLRASAWQVRDQGSLAGGSGATETALYEGWFAKGLDLHMALENTVGYYRRSQQTSNEKVDSYIVPLFTALKFFPFTRPEDRLEPFFEGGAGFSIGVEDRETTTTGLLGGTTTRNTNDTVLGYGFKAGPGLDWRFSRGLGLTVGGRYQWIRFTDEVGGARTWQGLGLEFGLTYRFQYE